MDDVVTDGGGGDAPEQGASGGGDTGGDAGVQSQQTPSVPDQSQSQQAPGEGPWAADLRALGLDEETFSKVDSHFREKVQPRMTELEQGQMPEGISQFLNDLNETPDKAFLQMAYELYGEDAIPFFQTALQYAYGDTSGQAPDANVPGQQEPQGDEGWEIDLDPDDRQALDFVKEQREDQAYDGALGEVLKQYPDHFPEGADLDAVRGLLSPFVVAADGDLAAGFDLYENWLDSLEPGQATEQNAETAAEGVDASAITPQVLGDGGLAPGAPVVKQGQDLGDAVTEMLSDLRASKGPPALG